MAFSTIFARATTFSTSKLNLGLCSHLPRFPLPPFSAHSSFCTTTTTAPSTDSVVIEKLTEKHPMQPEGQVKYWQTEEDEEAMYSRINLPGICKEGLKLKVVDRKVFVEAEEVVREPGSYKDDEKLRKYGGSIEFLGPLRMDEMRVQIKNGVLRIVVPKIKSEEKEDGVFSVNFSSA